MVAQNMLRMYEVKYVFSEKLFGFGDSFDVTKCLQQFEMPDVWHMSAPCSELPSTVSTMGENNGDITSTKICGK